MRIAIWVRDLWSAFNFLTRVLNWVGYISLSGIVLITSIDVFGRYFFNKPLMGSLEILEQFMAILGGFAILYTTTQRGHISVDLFHIMFPRRIRVIIDSFGSLLGFATWAFITYQVCLLGMRTLKTGDLTTVLHIPIAPFQFVLGLGLAFYSLVLLIQGLQPLLAQEPEIKDGGLSI